MFPSFPMYPALPTPPTPYEEFTKSLMMKLSLQNFFINMLSMDSFNDLMAIHQKIDEMFQGILHRQPSNSFFPMPTNNLSLDHSTFNVFRLNKKISQTHVFFYKVHEPSKPEEKTCGNTYNR